MLFLARLRLLFLSSVYVSPPLHLHTELYTYLIDDGACFRARGSRLCWPLTNTGWRLSVTGVCAALCMVTRRHRGDRGLVTRSGAPVCGPGCSPASPASWSPSPSRSSSPWSLLAASRAASTALSTSAWSSNPSGSWIRTQKVKDIYAGSIF